MSVVSPDPIRVLHVDDEPDFADVAGAFLEREDEQFTVETATNAADGLDRLTPDVDCVVSDYDMPGRNGIEFLERVREVYPDLPFVLFTGKGSEEVASDAISAGVTDYLQKEHGTDQYTVLANRIGNAVAQHRSQNALEASQKRLSLFIEQSSLGVIEWDDDFCVVRANDAATDILGDAGTELAGESWEHIVPDCDREHVGAVVTDLLAAEGGYHSINENVRADGERITCEWHNRVITDGDDDTVAIFSQFQDVTERTERQRELQARATAMEAATDGLAILDEDQEYVFVNEAHADIYGFDDPSQLLGESWRVCYDAPEMSRFESEVLPELAETGEWHGEMSVTAANGHPVHQELVLRQLDDGRVVCVVRDVTDRTERERRVKEIQRRTRTLMNTADRTETAQVAVDTACDVFGAQLNGVHLLGADGRTLEPVAHVDAVRETFDDPPTYDRTAESDPASSLVWETFENDEPLRIEDTREYGRLAEVTPVRSAVVLPLSGHGVFIVSDTEPGAFDDTDVALLEIFADSLTTAFDRVERELRMREREQQLETERDRLRALFETVPDPVVHGRFEDGKLVVVEVNPAFEETFGYEAETVDCEPVNDLIVPDDRQAEAERLDERARATGPVRQEVRRRTAEGLGDFLFQSVPVGDPDETDEHVGVYVDISAQKSYERGLERENERLDEFASVLSHDLRSPLTVAQGRLELVDEECETEHVDAIARAHDRIETLVDDVLTLAREGQSATVPEPVDLAEVVADCWADVETADATLVAEADRAVEADRSQLRHLLENLVRNAVRHGGDAVTVRMGDLPDGFYVADDGVGISDEERDRVFEFGYSTTDDGTGFGLRIAEQVAEAHGWAVAVEESQAGGARFEVTGVERPE